MLRLICQCHGTANIEFYVCELPRPELHSRDLDFGSRYMEASEVFVLFFPDLTPACDPELVTSFFSFLDW